MLLLSIGAVIYKGVQFVFVALFDKIQIVFIFSGAEQFTDVPVRDVMLCVIKEILNCRKVDSILRRITRRALPQRHGYTPSGSSTAFLSSIPSKAYLDTPGVASPDASLQNLER